MLKVIAQRAQSAANYVEGVEYFKMVGSGQSHKLVENSSYTEIELETGNRILVSLVGNQRRGKRLTLLLSIR